MGFRRWDRTEGDFHPDHQPHLHDGSCELFHGYADGAGRPRGGICPGYGQGLPGQHSTPTDHPIAGSYQALQGRGADHVARQRKRRSRRCAGGQRPQLGSSPAPQRQSLAPIRTRGTGTSLTFNAPPPEDLLSTGTGNYLEIRLTATDSKGLSKTITQNLQPNRVNVTFQSNPSGLSLQLNGTTFTAPRTFVSWEGYKLNVNAPSPQTLSGKTYVFSSWSDGKGTATRNRYRGSAEHLHGHLQELHQEWNLSGRDP